MRKTKIVCTLGPAVQAEEVMREIIREGMNVARFNFSHGSHEEHLGRYNLIKKLSEELNMPVATLLDTKGPEVRLGQFKDGPIMLQKGQTFTLTTAPYEGDQNKSHVNFSNLHEDVKVGGAILLDDGLVELKILKIDGQDIECEVLNNGKMSNNKGVNLPDTKLSMPFISEKDRADIIFGIKTGYDFIAASFTRTAEDILEIRQILKEHGREDIGIIAKIENREGVDNIDAIIEVSDAIMVARGDMGVEIPLQEVPILQKKIIKKTYAAGKQVITATQMLDSMMKNPRPTRAEATDVANAIYDGTGAIMLSGETAAGDYPVESVRIMARIAVETEQDIDYAKRLNNRQDDISQVSDAISYSTCKTAHQLGATAIITVTKAGSTAYSVSKFRPKANIIACTTCEETYRRLCLVWGVTPMMMDEKTTTDELFDGAIDVARETTLVQKGDTVVITGGMPLGVSGTTNTMKVGTV